MSSEIVPGKKQTAKAFPLTGKTVGTYHDDNLEGTVMKAFFHREGFLSACQLASAAVASRDVKPILRNLKAVADDGSCTLMATDLEIGIRLDVRSVKVEEAGAAILPTSQTVAVLRESLDEELELDADADRCLLRGKHNEFEMPGEDPDNFPDVPSFSAEQYHELQAGVLRDMIRRTIFAAATENPRYAVTGILWELDNESARLVATDGRRLAVTRHAAVCHGDHGTKGQTPVVPTKAMALLDRVLSDPDEIVRICIRPNDVLFKTDRATIYSRLVEGRYPDYKAVIPKKCNAKIPLVVGPFLTAIRQSAIMTDDESKRVSFRFDKNNLTLQAYGAKTGRAKVELPIDYDGKTIEINFDPKYLLEMLRVLDPETSLTMELTDNNTPAHCYTSDHYTYVVMPVS
ncbi:MAG: DNA polymerase III subunit beta [Gemmatales bacterium]|nr:MAG: DNA polymerase III subunit beta [Gemmatales bacterium]